jgi:hypothetical protein
MKTHLTQVEPSHLIINSKNDERLLEIKNNGDVYFKINGEFKKIDCEQDVSLMFIAVISNLTGISTLNKDELFSEIIKLYREGKLNRILE